MTESSSIKKILCHLYVHNERKRKRSDSVLSQNPLHQREVKKQSDDTKRVYNVIKLTGSIRRTLFAPLVLLLARMVWI